MNMAAMRQQLHQFIEQAGDKKVQGLYMLVEDEIKHQPEGLLSEEEIRILDADRAAHLNGASPSYTWEEAKKIIRRKDNS